MIRTLTALALWIPLSVYAEHGSAVGALVIGVSDYPNEPDWPLIPFAAHSAKSFHAEAKKSFRFRHSQVLVNDQATLEKVRVGLSSLTEGRNSEDTVLVYVTAIVTPGDGGDFWIQLYRPRGSTPSSRMSLRELISGVTSKVKAILVADLALVGQKENVPVRWPSMKCSYLSAIRDAAGTRRPGGHGLFTHHLLKSIEAEFTESGSVKFARLRDDMKKLARGNSLGHVFVSVQPEVSLVGTQTPDSPVNRQVEVNSDKEERPDFWKQNLQVLPDYDELADRKNSGNSTEPTSALSAATQTRAESENPAAIPVGAEALVNRSVPTGVSPRKELKKAEELSKKGVTLVGEGGSKPELTVKSVPAGATVEISPAIEGVNKDDAVTPVRLQLERNRNYTITLTRSGYHSEKREIVLDRRGEYELIVRLRRQPIMARLRSLVSAVGSRSDSYGNPTTKGDDRETGLPREVIERKTGMYLVLVKDVLLTEAGETYTGAVYVGKYEVTNLEYERFDASHSQSRGAKYRGKTVAPGDDNPVIQVSWNDAHRFGLWLSNKDTDLFRLPTASEWAQVYKKGTRVFQRAGKSIDLGQYANFPDRTAKLRFNWTWDPATADEFSTTAPVGKMKPNFLNVYQMDGNVWEWVQDSPDVKVERQQSRLCLGGSWLDRPAGLGSANRALLDSDEKKITVGFRMLIPIILD